MKKISVSLFLLVATVLFLSGQTVSNFTYKLDNGITVKTEHGWGHVWVQQQQATIAPSEEKQSVVVSVRTMGDLTKSSVTKLTSGEKEVRLKDAAPGTYNLKVTSALTGKPGTITFDVSGIVVKPNMKTSVNITIYDYQILIEETKAANNGLASYESRVIRHKTSNDLNPKCGIPTFFLKGVRDKSVVPAEKTSDLSGKIKSGTYDVQLVIDVCGHVQKIWLENFALKSDMSYKITTNLNAGEVTYAGVTRDVKKLHMYPAGTADRLKAAKPDKSAELGCYDPATSKFACPPGTYDVLVNIGDGTKYEWKKNIVVRTGIRSDIK